MLRKLLCFFFVCACTLPLYAQNNAPLPDDETKLLLRNEAVGGLIIHQNGWGAFFRKGKHQTGYKKRMFEIEAVSMKNPKEYSISNTFYDGSSYVFGKLNSLLILRTGMGRQKVMFSKAEKAGVEVKYSYYGGVSWGIVKPVYLDILHASDGPGGVIFTSERYDPIKHTDVDSIYGKSSFTAGLSQLRIYPGLYGKFGLNFEYGSDNESVKALETGFVIDYFPKAVPLMAYVPNNNVYFSFYICIMYGGRW